MLSRSWQGWRVTQSGLGVWPSTPEASCWALPALIAPGACGIWRHRCGWADCCAPLLIL